MRLLSWYEEDKETRKLQAKRRFEQAYPEQKEKMFFYCNRLENLFANAYPKHRIEKSSTLMNKLTATVNKEMQMILKSHKMTCKMNNKSLKWSDMKKCARIQDAENDNRKDEKKEEQPQEVVINLSNPRYQQQNESHNGQMFRTNYCGSCKRQVRHAPSECWRKLGKCFKCGSLTHKLRDCPEMKNNPNLN